MLNNTANGVHKGDLVVEVVYSVVATLHNYTTLIDETPSNLSAC